jgi:type II secretory pathway pseudopilin PulG
MKRGFSLLEVIIFLGIFSVFFLSATSIITFILSQSKLSEQRIMAAKHAEELLEWLKGERDADWVTFSTAKATTSGKTWCFSESPIMNWPTTEGSCDEYNLVSLYKRSVRLKLLSTPFAPTSTPTPPPTSTPAPTSTPGPSPTPAVQNFNPTADAYVEEDDSSNHGGETTLIVDSSALRQTYIKFDLTSLSGRLITSAVLNFYVTDHADAPQTYKQVADTSWIETGTGSINWNNKPALGATITSVNVGSGTGWRQVNITSYVSTKAGQIFSLGIDQTDSNAIMFNSKEASTNKPYLNITHNVGGAPAPTATPTSAPAPTAGPGNQVSIEITVEWKDGNNLIHKVPIKSSLSQLD